jgi:hypothetical protein
MMIGTITFGVAFNNDVWRSHSHTVYDMNMFEALEHVKRMCDDSPSIVHVWMIDWEVIEETNDKTVMYG